MGEVGGVVLAKNEGDGVQLLLIARGDVHFDFDGGDADVVAGTVQGSGEGGADLEWGEGFESKGNPTYISSCSRKSTTRAPTDDHAIS